MALSEDSASNVDAGWDDVADLLAIIPRYETFTGVGDGYLETVEKVCRAVNKAHGKKEQS